MNPNKELIEAGLLLAFEAGKWSGQVDLEEHFDRSQYSQALVESIVSRKTSMPTKEASNGKTVSVNLRSDEWRNGVRKSSKEYLDKALNLILTNLK